MTYDWADLEAMAEVDALTPACASIYPSIHLRIHPRTIESERKNEIAMAMYVRGASMQQIRDALATPKQ